ncbi:hypothetical protein Q7P37_008148 [Cladosporium fusiforme]
MVRQVQPLRISKPATPASPEKSPSMSRPLAEISEGSMRRNSPSYNQTTRKPVSPLEPSPFNENTSPTPPSPAKPSPRDFWSTRSAVSPSRLEVESTPDRSQSPSAMSAKRRASIEKLQSAGRVKSSKIFSLENKDAYDPDTIPIVERPAMNRPMSEQFVRNTFTRFDTMRNQNSPIRPSTPQQRPGHQRSESEVTVSKSGSPQRPTRQRSESETTIPAISPTKLAAGVALPESPEKDEPLSPTKSSFARISQFNTMPRAMFDPEMGSWSEENDECAQTPRTLHRQNKSVTFQTSPPVINEYELQTPEPSISATSGSREGSYDSDDYYYDQDMSFDRGSSLDRDREDSFDDDLENADKTPVVLPEVWSRMSPDEARNELANDEDDVFDTQSPSHQRPTFSRSESVTSDGESRPLPPLPGLSDNKRRESALVAAAAQRASEAARNLPPPAKRQTEENEVSHAESSPLVERAEDKTLLAERPTSSGTLQDQRLDSEDTINGHAQEQQEEIDDADHSELADLADYTNAPPRISRESILRKVRNTKYDFEDEDEDAAVDESEYVDEQQKFRPSYAELARMDPDHPIPSRENSTETSDDHHTREDNAVEEEPEIVIKQEPFDESIDMSAIPTMDETRMSTPKSPSRMEEYNCESSVLHHDVGADSADETEGSMYSLDEPELESTILQEEQSAEPADGKETLQDAMQLLTVKDYSEASRETPKLEKSNKGFMGLPEYLHADNDYDFGMAKYITPSPPPTTETAHKLDANNVPKLESSTTAQWMPTEVQEQPQVDQSPPGTPDSVIHHSTDMDDEEFEDAQAEQDDDFETELDNDIEHEPTPERQEIPERRATIKTGGKLKARPSGTPADFGALFGEVSDEYPVPAIPQGFQAQIENADASFDSSEGDHSKVDSGIDGEHQPTEKSVPRREGGKVALSIDIPAVENEDWGLEQEFDRVIQNQKKGYTMRENERLVVASNRNFSGSSNGTNRSQDPERSTSLASRPSQRGSRSATRKPSAEQFIKTEPWTGKQRRKSKRNSSAQRIRTDPAPPMPGHDGALGVVSEDHATNANNSADDSPEGAERGRLFVKVVGVKSLDLPMPRNDRVYFKLTLDNGLHCVTTAPLELGKSAPIGQEFELVVHDDLEFQLTLNTKLPPKPAPAPAPSSVPLSPSKTPKQSSFSRLLSSPKKRAERERQEREAQEAEQRRQQEETQRKRAAMHPTAWDLLHDLVNASDGSFARSYVNLSAHEQRCYGRPLTVDVPCYNEWALEKNSMVVNSVRSKRGAHAGPVRKPPYIIGALELQLLYVPKPNGATDEEMPKSMSSAIREMNRAHEIQEVSYEGHLSQQGGDCTHWRRRFFRLQGPRLTAYHEHTHQKRAVINLSKAVRVVDDRRTLVADPNAASSPVKPTGGSSRRKSAFAEEDEGYQYVEEGFRIRFANGETIDFYADSKASKEEWMSNLAQVVGKADIGVRKKGWTDLVFAHERAESAREAASEREAIDRPFLEGPAASGTSVKDFTQPQPPSRQLSDRKPVGSNPNRHSAYVPGSVPVGNRPGTPPLAPRTGHRSRDAVKSMIF